jgi:hypothetical protein
MDLISSSESMALVGFAITSGISSEFANAADENFFVGKRHTSFGNEVLG